MKRTTLFAFIGSIVLCAGVAALAQLGGGGVVTTTTPLALTGRGFLGKKYFGDFGANLFF